MKTRLCILSMLIMLLCIACTPATAESATWACPGCGSTNSLFFQFCPYCGTQRPDQLVCPNCAFTTSDLSYQFCPLCGTGFNTASAPVPTPRGPVLGLTIDNLATRSGPSTDYTELGTYRVKGEYVPIISYASDGSGRIWVQCEVPYGGAKRRVYTGLKRFDTSTVDLNLIRNEDDSKYFVGAGALTNKQVRLYFGPGKEYGVCKQVPYSCDVAVVAIENGWAQVQFVCDSPVWRAWVPESEVVYDHSEG